MADKRLTLAVFNESGGWRLPDSLVTRIVDAAGPSVEVVCAESRADVDGVIAETNYLVGMPPADEETLMAAGQLEWIQLTNAVGDFELSLLPALRSGVRVCSAASIRAPQVAEHALALTLALSRRLHDALEAQHEQRWAPDEIASKLVTLHGATAGIVSMGPIGREIATRLQALGMHVIATEREGVSAADVAEEVLGAHQTGELLARSDVVVVSAVRTPATEKLIGRDQFGQMKKTALLIDVSRGGVVQQSALIEALHKGKIAGAGIDVFETEPLPPNSALWTLDNVIITPHISSASPAYWSRASEVVCENLQRLRDGQPLIDEVAQEWYLASGRR